MGNFGSTDVICNVMILYTSLLASSSFKIDANDVIIVEIRNETGLNPTRQCDDIDVMLSLCSMVFFFLVFYWALENRGKNVCESGDGSSIGIVYWVGIDGRFVACFESEFVRIFVRTRVLKSEIWPNFIESYHISESWRIMLSWSNQPSFAS